MNRHDYNTQDVVSQLGRGYGAEHRRFIGSHVRNLLDSGPVFILKAYRTKTRTISLHLIKLYDAQLDAEVDPSPYSLGLVRYYVRELDRLNTELRILENAMSISGISYL